MICQGYTSHSLAAVVNSQLEPDEDDWTLTCHGQTSFAMPGGIRKPHTSPVEVSAYRNIPEYAGK